MIWKTILLNGVKSDYIISNTGIVKNTITDKILKPYINQDGYCRVDLRMNSSRYNKFVHVLVADAFIPNPDNKPTVNHINGVKTNNNDYNLEWSTHSEQLIHAYKNKLRTGKQTNTKYSSDQITTVCELLSTGVPISNISDKTKVPIPTIHDIYLGKSWNIISRSFNFMEYSNNKFDSDTRNKIVQLLTKNKSPKEICAILGISYNRMIKQRILRLRHKIDKSSTTIENNDNYYTIDIHCE